MNDLDLYNDWPTLARQIAESIEPELARGGAEYYPVNVRKQARVGWQGSGRSVVLGKLDALTDGLRVSLRVGADSRHLEPAGPLRRAKGQKHWGSIELTSPGVPALLRAWVQDGLKLALPRLDGSLHSDVVAEEVEDQCSDAVMLAVGEAGWQFPLQNDHPPANVFFEGVESFYDIQLETEVDAAPMFRCRIRGVPPLQRRRRAVAEAVLRVNRSMLFGSFLFDFDTRELEYFSAIPLHDCPAGLEAVELHAYFGVSQLDSFLPFFRSVSQGEANPSEFDAAEE